MTVRELANVISDAKSIDIVFDGYTHQYIKGDELSASAYGDFIVKDVTSCADNPSGKLYTFLIAIQPMRICTSD